MQSEMQTAYSRVWTQVTESISYINKYYATTYLHLNKVSYDYKYVNLSLLWICTLDIL